MCHSLQITHRIVHSHLPGCHLKAVHGGEEHIEVCPKFIGASCLASVKRGISLCVAELKLNLKTCAVHSDDIAPRQSEVVGEKDLVSFPILGEPDNNLDFRLERLAVYLPPEIKLLDSCMVSNDSFTLKGRLEKNQRGLIFVQNPNRIAAAMVEMYLQPADMGVDLKPNGHKYIPTYTNAPLQAEYESLMKEFKTSDAYKKYQVVNEKIQKEFVAKSSASPKLKAQQREMLYAALNQLLDKEGRCKNEALTSLISDYSSLLSTEQLEALCKRMDASMQDTYYLNKTSKYVD